MKTWASWELTASDSRTKCLTVLTCESWGRLRNIGFQTNVTHVPGPCVCWYIGALRSMREFKRGPGTPFKRGCRRRCL